VKKNRYQQGGIDGRLTYDSSSGVSMVMRLLEGRRRYASLSSGSFLVIQCEHVRKEAVAVHETYPDVFAKLSLCFRAICPRCF
jgi:hypothetical protein